MIKELIKNLKDKKEGFIGILKNSETIANSEGFREGLVWAIDSAEIILKKDVMIIPKEKAQDLVNRFRMILMDEDTDCGNEILCTMIAIKNAHVTVNELLSDPGGLNKSYWDEVKNELDSI